MIFTVNSGTLRTQMTNRRYSQILFLRNLCCLSFFLWISVLISCRQPTPKLTTKSFTQNKLSSLQQESLFPYLYQGKLNMFHFLFLKEEVNLLHLERKRINISSGYGSAVKAAYSTISIEFYPKDYYEKYKNDPNTIISGPIINSNSDDFILIQRPKEIDAKIAESQRKKRKELSIHFSSLHIDQQKFESILNQIYETTKQNNPNTDQNLLKENIIFSAINGYLEELDHSTKIWKSKTYLTSSEAEKFNVLFKISHQIFRDKKTILCLKVSNFNIYEDNTNAAEAVKKIIQHELHKENNQFAGILLDFRENDEGILSISRNFISLFSSKPVLYSRVDSTKSNSQSPAIGFERITKLPIAILVNETTKGIAEHVAGSLRENENALILGSKTYGDGSIQSRFYFEPKNGYEYKITTSKITLASGYEIEGNGIIPDLLIEDNNQPEGIEKKKDYWNVLKAKTNPNDLAKNSNPNLIAFLKKIEMEKPKIDETTTKDILLEKSLYYFRQYLETNPETP
ncbi:hypothetical protein CH361_07710 [Leptospira brenneri]|nr:hypothetical protein CH361_07710 [Leptospira brenneri]